MRVRRKDLQNNTKKYFKNNKRPLTKTASWRAVGTTLSFGVAYLFTGTLTTSLGITAMIAIVNTVAYYLHERQWSRTDWGRGSRN